MRKYKILQLIMLSMLLSVENSIVSRVVALGASNTFGRGQGRHTDGVQQFDAFPAQLQSMLRKQGCRASVLNAGVAGDTTEGMLSRFPDVVGRDTRVLILQPGGNDMRQGSADMTDDILQAAAARKIRVVMLERLEDIAGPYLQPDGQHFNVQGHVALAAYLLPQVRAALGC